MATITLIDLSTPNDGLGDPLRDGGSIINTNFKNLNTDKLEKGGFVGTGADLANSITALGLIKVDKSNNINESINGIKTFESPIIGDLDGRALPRATTTGSYTAMENTSSELWLGSQANSITGGITGSLGEFLLFDYVLSTDDIDYIRDRYLNSLPFQ